jgi:hypothetical protein
MQGLKELKKVRFHYELHCIMLANLPNKKKSKGEEKAIVRILNKLTELAPNLIKYIHIEKTFPSDLISSLDTRNCIQTVRLRVPQHIIKGDLKASCYVIGEKNVVFTRIHLH